MTSAAVHLPLIFLGLTKPSVIIKSIQSFPNKHTFRSSSLISRRDSLFKLRCIREDSNYKSFQDFSILKTDFQCDNGSIWSTMAFYIFSLHIPLSFGGLSIIAKLLHQTVVDPETQALSFLLIQSLELAAFILLLQYSENPFNVLSFFETKVLAKERNWLLASMLGLGFLLGFVFLTSLIADKFIGPKDVNLTLKEILLGGPVCVTGCTLVYCVVTPFLEETVYRGFLLTSLASKMEWHKAVVISSIIFGAIHFSIDSFLQLFVIGVVLGCSYCWSGTLVSPYIIHSLYNALILFTTFTS